MVELAWNDPYVIRTYGLDKANDLTEGELRQIDESLRPRVRCVISERLAHQIRLQAGRRQGRLHQSDRLKTHERIEVAVHSDWDYYMWKGFQFSQG